MALPVGAYDELRRVRGVGAPDGLLRVVVEQADLPRVDAEDRGDPAGRATRRGDEGDGGVEVDRVGLEAVEALGLQHAEEAGLLQLLDRRIGHLAQSLGLVSALAQRGKQVSYAVEHRLGHCSSLEDRLQY